MPKNNQAFAVKSEDVRQINRKLRDLQSETLERIEAQTLLLQEIEKNLIKRNETSNQYMKFIRGISFAVDLDSLFRLLRSEILKFDFIKNCFLLYQNPSGRFSCLGFRGFQLVEINISDENRLIDTILEQWSIPQLEFENIIPIAIPAMQDFKAQIVLHCLDRKRFNTSSVWPQFWESYSSVFRLGLERILLEKSAESIAHLWSQTFDDFPHPIALRSKEGRLLRCNRAFRTLEAHLDDQHQRINFERRQFPLSFGHVEYYLSLKLQRELWSRYLQQEKFSNLAEMAYQVSEKFQSPLGHIRKGVENIQHRLWAGDSATVISKPNENQILRDHLQEVLQAVERIDKVIRDFNEFSSLTQSNSSELVDLDLNALVLRTLPLIKNLTQNHQLLLHLSEGELRIRIPPKPHFIQHILFNLLANAVAATAKYGVIEIQTQTTISSQESSASVGSPASSVWTADLMVRDSGHGVPQQYQERIFEPFFTTKSAGIGTGLGLFICRKWMESLGGSLDLLTDESRAQEGACFRLRFPL